MNVLHINQSDIGGGAAIAGYRLHNGLLNQGISSKLLVGNAKTHSPLVSIVSPTTCTLTERLLAKITIPLGLNYVHRLSTFKINKHPWYQSANILNLHNLHSEYFNYLAIPFLTSNKPAIFTLHDMWSFTGHCSYSYDCERWQIGCGKCPYLEIYPSVKRDATALEWRLKKLAYAHAKLTIIAPSNYLYNQVQKSILSHFPSYIIPHGVDINAYQPLDCNFCRKALDLPLDKFILLFSADNLTDPRKGSDILLKVLDRIPESIKKNLILLTFGNGGESILELLDMEYHSLGYIANDRLKCIAYSAADLFLFPTKADIFGLVALESIACGTPVVSFNTGGVTDIVRHGVSGYLALSGDSEDFLKGILQLLDNKEKLEKLSYNCRKIVLSEYSIDLQVKRYISVYKDTLCIQK